MTAAVGAETSDHESHQHDLPEHELPAEWAVAVQESDDRQRIAELESTVVSLQQAIDSIHACPSADSTHTLLYQDGWIVRPRDRNRTPFELKFNIHNQFRYTGFANENDRFVDRAGNTTPVKPRNDFDVNRGRLVFSGYAFDPKLTYYANIDYNTVASNPVLLLLSWFAYDFNEAFSLRMGLGKVPGTWEWEESSRVTLGAERTMATTFFRPSITAGVWAQGSLTDNLHYRAMIGDGFNTFTLRAAEVDANFVYSAFSWLELGEPYEDGLSDLEGHMDLALRLGHGITYTRNDGEPTGVPGPEQTVIRLTDGTRLVEPGALAPGATVNQFDITLYAVHFGAKYRGWSFSSEYFFRWLSSIEADAPLPDDSIFDHGYFVQGGLFLFPRRLELYALGSYVTGEFGSGREIGGGLNWYHGGRRGSRMTFDCVHLTDSPTEQDRTGFVAGADGTLFRLQWWTYF